MANAVAVNIFALDSDPRCGAFLMDKHVVKMPLETAQMLSTVLGGGPHLYKPAYAKHPCTLWAGKTKSNFRWLVTHGLSICEEYTARYGKRHASQEIIEFAALHSHRIPEGPLTPFACAMPEEFIVSDNPVINYRNYYRKGKAHLAQWKRNKPFWYDAVVSAPVNFDDIFSIL